MHTLPCCTIVKAPKAGSGFAGGVADLAVNDIYTFYGVTARIPLYHNGSNRGGLDWVYEGPNNDPEFMYALNRHYIFEDLLSAWEDTGNGVRYAGLFDQLVAGWVSNNPMPDTPDNQTWRTLEAGLRMGVSWPQAFFGFQTAAVSGLVQNATMLAMVSSMAEHAGFLYMHGLDGNVNHVSMQLNGLATVSMVLPEMANASVWWDAAAVAVEEDMASDDVLCM
jgi:hypothetical protein